MTSPAALADVEAESVLQFEFLPGRDSGRVSSGQPEDLHLDRLFQQNPSLQSIILPDNSALHRADFYQCIAPWYRGANAGNFPLSWVETEQGLRHPLRPEVPAGEVYRRHMVDLGMDFSLRRLDAELDLECFTDWMNQPRVAEFWEAQGDREKQRNYIEGVPGL